MTQSTERVPQQKSDGGLVRALGPGMAIAMVVGNVIGTGIFAKPVEIAPVAGNVPLNLSLARLILDVLSRSVSAAGRFANLLSLSKRHSCSCSAEGKVWTGRNVHTGMLARIYSRQTAAAAAAAW